MTSRSEETDPGSTKIIAMKIFPAKSREGISLCSTCLTERHDYCWLSGRNKRQQLVITATILGEDWYREEIIKKQKWGKVWSSDEAGSCVIQKGSGDTCESRSLKI